MLSQNILRRSLSFKAFIKHFEAPQRRVKIKTYVNFSLRPGLGREGLIAYQSQKQKRSKMSIISFLEALLSTLNSYLFNQMTLL